MQFIEETEKIISIQSNIDNYKNELEKIFAKTDIKNKNSKETINLFNDIKNQNLLIKKFSNKNISIEDYIEFYRKSIEITTTILKIAKILEKIGEKEVSDNITKGCSLLSIEIIISIVKLISKIAQITEIKENNSILKIMERQIDYLRIDNKKNIEDALIIEGFTNIDQYISAIIILNQQFIKTKNKLNKRTKAIKGFGNDLKPEDSRENSKLKLLLTNLIKNSLDIIREKDNDRKIVIQNIQWEEYENILETIGEVSWCKISYLDGVLELVTTSERHKTINRYIADLIDDYFYTKEIGYIPVGAATYKLSKEKKGKEADSAYKFTEEREYPDFAIEVNLSSGGIASLEIFKGFRTKEVWMWDKRDNIEFYIFQDSKYVKSETSYFLKGVTPNIIKKYVKLIENNKLNIIKYRKDFINEINLNNF